MIQANLVRLAGLTALPALAVAALLTAPPGCGYEVNLGSGGSASVLTGTLTDGRTDHGTCPGVPCATGEVCCYLDGACFDPIANPEACVATADLLAGIPSGYTDGVGDRTLCGSDADCAADEFCAPVNHGLCLGVGVCIGKSPATCGAPSPASSLDRAVCGCDSITYPDDYSACMAGVRTVGGYAACGHGYGDGAGGAAPEGASAETGLTGTPCGTAGLCAHEGEVCCSITGRCYDPAKPGACAFPPAGFSYPCQDNADCAYGQLCYAEACEGPGGCADPLFPDTTACGSVLAPTCGCDGTTYTSPACAYKAKVRVAHDGACE
jgi:hypothetical protein